MPDSAPTRSSYPNVTSSAVLTNHMPGRLIGHIGTGTGHAHASHELNRGVCLRNVVKRARRSADGPSPVRPEIADTGWRVAATREGGAGKPADTSTRPA